MRPSTLAIIQANHTDLLPGDSDPPHYVIGRLRSSHRIDRVVVAAPATRANEAFIPLARSWNVDLFRGSEYDVIARLIGAAEQAQAASDAVIARVVLNRFYLDTALVDRQIDLLRDSHADFVTLPYDFDINFGADVLTLACLRRVDRALAGQDSPDREHIRFRPWLSIEDHPEQFSVVTCENVPSYPPSTLDDIRASGLFAERDCCAAFIGYFSPAAG